MVVIVTGYTLFLTWRYDVVFTLENQRFGKVSWLNMHIILHASTLSVQRHNFKAY